MFGAESMCTCAVYIREEGEEVCWGHVFPGRGVTLQAWRHEDINTTQCGSPLPTHTHRKKMKNTYS